ncbi:MAG TPA: 16S rRNA (adenine(1518)-N(6)/adenine(1519)-N(6))-dimethyltransferase RsmA, partial [Candidatus Saccharimonadales bacterium]
HWLRDRDTLTYIADEADISSNDTVLEIGPGLGTLTSELLRRAKNVVAVEFDPDLARKLPGQFPGKNLEVINQDILLFDLSALPAGYKVVANVPYYITSKIVQLLMTANNKPAVVTLLVQKEVAERLAAEPGNMSILAISAQVFADVALGETVPAELFTPPPKVDSAVITLTVRSKPLIESHEEKAFFRLVKAGFSAKRKKLSSSLAGGLRMAKADTAAYLKKVGLPENVRAEDLSISQWLSLLHSGIIEV